MSDALDRIDAARRRREAALGYAAGAARAGSHLASAFTRQADLADAEIDDLLGAAKPCPPDPLPWTRRTKAGAPPTSTRRTRPTDPHDAEQDRARTLDAEAEQSERLVRIVVRWEADQARSDHP